MTLTEIRQALETRGLRPLKQLGQNFLHDQNLAAWLAGEAVVGVPAESTVVEIGPGLGSMTGFLLERTRRLIALEKDRGLCVFLREKFSREMTAGKLDLREGDALELLPELEKPGVVCGNLPYYLSTPLIMACMRWPEVPLFFVLQKEVGERMASASGGKVYGALSVLVQAGYEVELVRTLPGPVFYPAPEVASVAVRLRPRAVPLVGAEEKGSFAEAVHRGFSQRRKKLSNLLPVEDGRRAEHLSPEEWVALWRRLPGRT